MRVFYFFHKGDQKNTLLHEVIKKIFNTQRTPMIYYFRKQHVFRKSTYREQQLRCYAFWSAICLCTNWLRVYECLFLEFLLRAVECPAERASLLFDTKKRSFNLKGKRVSSEWQQITRKQKQSCFQCSDFIERVNMESIIYKEQAHTLPKYELAMRLFWKNCLL